MRARPDPFRIAALTVAVAAQVATALLCLRPSAPLRQAVVDDAPVVQVVPVHRPAGPRPPAPPPPVPTAPAPVVEAPPRPASPEVGIGPETGDDLGYGMATADTTEAPLWQFDPNAWVGLAVYADRAAVDIPPPEQPPEEIAGYRAGFDPAAIPGLAAAAGGSATFDVLVDAAGAATAVAIVERACPDDALPIAMSLIGQWRYVPARRAGTPVAGWLRVALRF